MVTFNQLKEDTILGSNELLTKNQLVQRHRRFVESSIHSLDILIDDLSDSSSKGEPISTVATVPMSHFGITVSPTSREYETVVCHIARRINKSTGFSYIQKEYHHRNDSNDSKHYGFVCRCKHCDRVSIDPIPYATQLYTKRDNSQYGILLLDYHFFNGFISISLSHPGSHGAGGTSVTETTSDSIVLVPQNPTPPGNATVIADRPSTLTETTSESMVVVPQTSTPPDKEAVPEDDADGDCPTLSVNITISSEVDGYLLVDQQEEK